LALQQPESAEFLHRERRAFATVALVRSVLPPRCAIRAPLQREGKTLLLRSSYVVFILHNTRRSPVRWSLLLALLPTLVLGACRGGAAAEAEHPERILKPGISSTIGYDHHLLVDQFGYRPDDPKVAVIRSPRRGYDAGDDFEPGSDYEVRRSADGVSVLQAHPLPWLDGQVETSSGDRGWWLDFSSVRTPGSYFLYDANRHVRSPTFNIRQDVYRDVLTAALRTYFYQRSGFPKRAPYAADCWTDEAAYLGPGQDREARDVTQPEDRSRVRDLSGGWFDAGDTNKYVTFAAQPVHQLLTAYAENPTAFGDDSRIPESGNGIPDVLDEIRWETDWLKRMQFPDGSVALKVGEITDTKGVQPGRDSGPRYYVPACTSATIAASGMFAHAALVFRAFPQLSAESAELRKRAASSWADYAHRAKQTHCDSGQVRAGNADWNEADQNGAAVVAAIYLFALTGSPQFEDYIHAHFRETRSYTDFGWSRYKPEQGEALLYYTTLDSADRALRERIRADKANDSAQDHRVYGLRPYDDLYRAFVHDEQYHWGSNSPRANYGNTNIDMLTYRISETADAADLTARALGILHYFHGVNPFGMVYLSNMYALGATRSVNEIYHTWFWHGTKWSDALRSECGPPPGYVPGGPNAGSAAAGVPATLMPPVGQPPQKAYRDWNTGWPENSWAVTEPGIYYQSAYIQLLSKFAR
jgi:endoglucanase